MAKLRLNLKGQYFDQIKSGEKIEEFRLCNLYWNKRLAGRNYDEIILMRGYPAKHDYEKIIHRPYKGWIIKTIIHQHFGDKPVSVFAIIVN